MAYIDNSMKTGSGKMVHIKVPASPGGSDRNIYLDGSSSGYKLGDGNDRVYTTSGREVSSSIQGWLATM